jgi:quercetin dioxygenase-like cupin family protein
VATEKPESGLQEGRAIALVNLADYAPDAVVSRTIAKSDSGTITFFAFDKGQELSEHTAPFDAYVIVLDGAAELTIGGESVRVAAGETALMPANVPHAVSATERFKMLLVMLR